MTDIELYKEIGGWIYTFHNRDFFYSRLLKDFQHDCFLKLHGKEVNREYVKITCKYYPWQAMKNLYGKRMKSHSEFVLVDAEGEPIDEFADWSNVPVFEFEAKKAVKKNHKDARKVKVLYRNGEEEVFDSLTILGKVLGLKQFRVLYRYVGKPLSERFTKRKMSHIKLISYLDDKEIKI
jgi:hypothetical protein